MVRGIELVLTHPALDELTTIGPDEVRMTEDAHVALVDAVASLGYEVDPDDLVVVDLDDDEEELDQSQSPLPCPDWSRNVPHDAHEWDAPVDGRGRCPGWSADEPPQAHTVDLGGSTSPYGSV